jgi:6-phosphofructokinase 1
MTLRIGILTGGGDVPGLNPCIKAVVNGAEERGWEVLGIRRGWAGLLNYNPDMDGGDARDWVGLLTSRDVRTIDRYGGTHLHTSRTNPQRVRPGDMPDFLKDAYPFPEGATSVDCTPHVLRAIEHLGLDAIVPIGGDDTLSYAVRLHKEGIKIVAIPKTMDNDVYGTDYCIGFSTAVTRSVDFINALRTPTGSHERIAVVELFGRTGETALISAYRGRRSGVSECRSTSTLAQMARTAPATPELRHHHHLERIHGRRTGGGIRQEDAYGHRKLGHRRSHR